MNKRKETKNNNLKVKQLKISKRERLMKDLNFKLDDKGDVIIGQPVSSFTPISKQTFTESEEKQINSDIQLSGLDNSNDDNSSSENSEDAFIVPIDDSSLKTDILKKSDYFQDCFFYNSNYSYSFTGLKELTESGYDKLDSLNYWLNYNQNKILFAKEIVEAPNVKSHKIENGKLFYEFECNYNHKCFYLSIENLGNLNLFLNVQEYLFIKLPRSDSILSISLRIFEVLKWFKIYSVAHKNILIDDCIHIGVSDRQTPKRSKHNNKYKPLNSNMISQEIITTDNKKVYKVKREKKDCMMSFQEIKNQMSRKQFKDFKFKLKSNLIASKRKNIRFDVAIHSNDWNRLSKSERRSHLKKLQNDIRLNENNCFIYAIRCISNSFPLREYEQTFKNLSLALQMHIANKRLKEKDHAELHYVGYFDEVLDDVIKSLKDKCLIVYQNMSRKAHIEAVEDFKILFNGVVVNENELKEKKIVRVYCLKTLN
jgi:hypothetical protein